LRLAQMTRPAVPVEQRHFIQAAPAVPHAGSLGVC
jgi:hypothetical protein